MRAVAWSLLGAVTGVAATAIYLTRAARQAVDRWDR